MWRAGALILILLTLISCAVTNSGQQASLPSATPNVGIAGGGLGGVGGSGKGAGSGGNNGGAGTGGGNTISTQAPTPNPTPDPTPSNQGPFVVKQIMSLGHESISGEVCSLTAAFTVFAVAPEVSWNFTFVPGGPNQGKWTYAYSITSAGETHNANGSYTISQVNADGTLLLTMTGSDSVAFKGFSGKFPVNYSFNLVPSGNTSCPATH